MGKDGFLAKKNGLFGLWQQKKTRDNHFLKKTTPGHLFVLFKDFSDSVLFRRPFSGEYQDQVPTPIPEIKPMRAFWLSLALCLVPGISRADVVYTRTDTPVTLADQFSANSGSGFSSTVGQSFMNIGQGSTATSVLFRLISNSGTFNTGSFSVSIYSAGSSTSTQYSPTGSALFTSAAINLSSNNLTTTAQDFTFTTFTKNTSADLTASAVYVAVLQWSGVTFGGSSGTSFSALGYGNLAAPYAAYNSVVNGAGNSGQQLYGTIDVTAVPEPGTLLLGGIAAACGSGGVWWRRRRLQTKQPNATETAG